MYLCLLLSLQRPRAPHFPHVCSGRNFLLKESVWREEGGLISGGQPGAVAFESARARAHVCEHARGRACACEPVGAPALPCGWSELQDFLTTLSLLLPPVDSPGLDARPARLVRAAHVVA